jgi:hypothetical protein
LSAQSFFRDQKEVAKTMKIKVSLLSLSVLIAGLAVAQEKPPNMPPKVLVVTREFVKPGRAGTAHEKTESAFVQALSNSKWPTHYLAVDSLSGRPRSLFLTAFDSFEAWEKDTLAVQKNPALSASLDRAALSDGDLLTDIDGGAFAYREEFSLRPGADIPHMRYFEISRFHIKPGHDKDWERLVKMVVGAYEKIPDVQWASYEGVYGVPDGTFLFFTPRKSASEVDRAFAQGKQFETIMGEGGMKQMRELSAETIESSETNLFVFNPRMSYVSEEWTKADPEFWTVKPVIAMGHPKKKGEAEAAKK